jgi:hypothetical protein
MSRGHGQLQRKILELLQQYPDGAPAVTPSLDKYGPFEWTAAEFYYHIHWDTGMDTDLAEERAYSLKTSIRRALGQLRAEGLIYRRPSSRAYREPGSIPWVWALTTQGRSPQT